MAFVHIAIKIIGAVILLIVMVAANALFRIPLASQAVGPAGVAMIHTVFNIAITVMLMPCGRLLERLALAAVPDKESKESHAAPFLDSRLISTPSVAIAECEHKTVEMAYMAKQTIFDAIALFGSFSESDAKQIKKDEDVIDLYEDRLGSYLVQLSGKDLSEGDSAVAYQQKEPGLLK